jgi:shikimate dehydrogenase
VSDAALYDPARTRLAVLGSPIAHSKSPAIHRAAYRWLGMDWTYESAEVTGETLEEYIRSRGPEWRGLSLTMPLKRDVLALLDRRDPVVDLVGAANTVRFTDDGIEGFNTDVAGVEKSFTDAGVVQLGTVVIIGAGATAASVLAGVTRLGAQRVTVVARAPERARPLQALAASLGVTLAVTSLAETQDSVARTADAVVNTVPGGLKVLNFREGERLRALLFDVAYDPWPTPLAQHWYDVGGTVIPGHNLLVNQALIQIRIFCTGDPTIALPEEEGVMSAMTAAVWED